MGRRYDLIDDSLNRWLSDQPLYFVATAPSGDAGHLNLSPKGGAGTFRVLSPTTVAYLDLVGSGIETVSHLRENGRIVLMFCAFAGPPKIVRLHGQGRVVTRDDPEFAALLEGFACAADLMDLARSVVVVEASRIADSCGFVVPQMTYQRDRDQLVRWGQHRAELVREGWREEYEAEKNVVSIDGLPGLRLAAVPAAGND